MSLDLYDPHVFPTLLNVCHRFGVGPTTSIEAESYFRKLLLSYDADTAPSLAAWLEQEIAARFLSLAGVPEWLQAAEWPVVDGAPLVFAGQLDYSVLDNILAGQMFHDDTSVYVFIGRKIAPVVVMQQM